MLPPSEPKYEHGEDDKGAAQPADEAEAFPKEKPYPEHGEHGFKLRRDDGLYKADTAKCRTVADEGEIGAEHTGGGAGEPHVYGKVEREGVRALCYDEERERSAGEHPCENDGARIASLPPTGERIVRGIAEARDKTGCDTSPRTGRCRLGQTTAGKAHADRSCRRQRHGDGLHPVKALRKEQACKDRNPYGSRVLQNDVHGCADKLNGVLGTGVVHADAPDAEEHKNEDVPRWDAQKAREGAVQKKGGEAEKTTPEGTVQGCHAVRHTVFADESQKGPKHCREHDKNRAGEHRVGMTGVFHHIFSTETPAFRPGRKRCLPILTLLIRITVCSGEKRQYVHDMP